MRTSARSDASPVKNRRASCDEDVVRDGAAGQITVRANQNVVANRDRVAR
jgi:hypothetical protein